MRFTSSSLVPAHACLVAAAPFGRALESGWQCVSTAAGACASPAALAALPVTAQWLDAPVPGTVAAAWRAAGQLDLDTPRAFAFDDHWYRLALPGNGPCRLRFQGLASIAEVWIDEEKRLDSTSMFVAHELDVELRGDTTLYLCFRSLGPALAAKRTRARWRPKLAQPATLRNVRTTLLGHMPGWCPPIQPVGPWRAVQRLDEAAYAIERADLHTRVDGSAGILDVVLRFVHPAKHSPEARLTCAGESVQLEWRDAHTLAGTMRIDEVPLWWPHTHGTPTLHMATLHIDGAAPVELGTVGFRSIDVDRGPDGAGFQLIVNGVPVFARGACWTCADIVTLDGTPQQLEASFALAREAGLNMLRVGGTMLYESDSFYQLADAYGMLVWQDFAFANFDYPTDAAFEAAVHAEATQFLARTRRFASLAVLCGGSEADQQAAMLGLPASLGEQKLFTAQLPALVAAHRRDVPYVVNSPSVAPGDTDGWPFGTRAGITHYYGVGAYQRPLDDARRANVRFASECLAFANVPDDVALHAVPHATRPHEPNWKRAVPRDPGASWDFDDVREHYLKTLYGVEPSRLRYEDPERYLDLSRAVVAELIGEVFSEWRRSGSSCAGGLVWQFQDLRAGCGWGVVDALGAPKSAWHGMKRVFGSVQLLVTDEGLDGLDIHLVNERATPLTAQLDIRCLRDGATAVVRASRELTLEPRGTTCVKASALIGQFFDFTYAYRFGPRQHEATVVSLRDAATGELLSQAFHFPDRTLDARHDLGLDVRVEPAGDGWELVVSARRLSRWVHIVDPHFFALDDWFHLPPGEERRVRLVARPATSGERRPEGEVSALNGAAAVRYEVTGVD
ncbi:glycoside hydrolase family 2 protein [Paraburkholderia sp. PREW-6R]|uniref:glycosyl hydrolase 2 galactose-binding domain-containing protein n=1 Tax=Paraburkholderia sp. PREW-6R TaxID=3141544 RepID=UPI0031F47ED8